MDEQTQKGIIGVIGAFIICASVLLAAMLIGFTRVIQVERDNTSMLEAMSVTSANTLTSSEVEQLEERIKKAQEAIMNSKQSRTTLKKRAEQVEQNSKALAGTIAQAKQDLVGKISDIDNTYAIVEGLKTMMQIESRTVQDWKSRLDKRVQDVENIDANIDDRAKRIEVIENSRAEYDEKYDQLTKLYNEKNKVIQPIYDRVDEIELKSTSNKTGLKRVKTLEEGIKSRLEAVDKRLNEIEEIKLAQATYQRVPGKQVLFLGVVNDNITNPKQNGEGGNQWYKYVTDPKRTLLGWSQWYRDRSELTAMLMMTNVTSDDSTVEDEKYKTIYDATSKTLVCTVKSLNGDNVVSTKITDCIGWVNAKYGMATFCVLSQNGLDELIRFIGESLQGYDVHAIGSAISKADLLETAKNKLTASNAKQKWYASTVVYGNKMMGYVGTGRIVANEHFDKYDNVRDSILLVEQRYTF